MTKAITLLGCVIVFACAGAMAQTLSSASPKIASGSSCSGPLTITGKKGLQTCRSASPNNRPSSGSTVAANSSLPANPSILGRLASRKLPSRQRPGTPDFVPTSNTISNRQLP